MKIDVSLSPDSLGQTSVLANKAEEDGFDGIWVSETSHDPFLQLALMAEHTNRIQIGTAIALAFTRSPTVLAQTAWDIQKISNGRLVLGLGSQVRGHVQRRFSEEWFPPVERMREVITLLRAIWSNWQNGKKLDFKGRYYTVNLMSPFFSPGPIEKPEIPIYLAAVNRKMCSLAGEMCQGVHVHPLNTVRYLKEVMLPAIEDGMRLKGRSRKDFDIVVPVFTAIGEDDKEIAVAKNSLRRQIAFYASTKVYRGVMELHGWGETSDRLYKRSVAGDWAGMSEEISNAMVDEFVVEGRWCDIAQLLEQRYRSIADRVYLYLPYDASSRWRSVTRVFCR
jgi:probable F420-dependent oxidoreductase